MKEPVDLDFTIGFSSVCYCCNCALASVGGGPDSKKSQWRNTHCLDGVLLLLMKTTRRQKRKTNRYKMVFITPSFVVGRLFVFSPSFFLWPCFSVVGCQKWDRHQERKKKKEKGGQGCFFCFVLFCEQSRIEQSNTHVSGTTCWWRSISGE